MTASSDDSMRRGSAGWVAPVAGMAMPRRTCGRCNTRGAGGRRHAVYGWVCLACHGAMQAKRAAKAARVQQAAVAGAGD